MLKKRLARRLNKLNRFKKSESGVTAIEFAMVGAPFLYLLCAIFETGFMLFSEYIIENGVADAGRLIRTGQAQTMTKDSFKKAVCGNLAAFLKCDTYLHIDVRKFTNFQTVNLPNPIKDDDLSPDVKSGTFQGQNCPMQVVIVRAYYEWKLFTPGITQLANIKNGKRLLSTGAAFRNEPFPQSGICP